MPDTNTAIRAYLITQYSITDPKERDLQTLRERWLKSQTGDMQTRQKTLKTNAGAS